MEINNDLNNILMAAFNEAKDRKHEYLTPEHILYASLYNQSGKSIMESVGCNIDNLKNKIEIYFQDKLPIVENDETVRNLYTELVENTDPKLVLAFSGQKNVDFFYQTLKSMIEDETRHITMVRKISGRIHRIQ